MWYDIGIVLLRTVLLVAIVWGIEGAVINIIYKKNSP
jgi:hypothetical protein